MLSSNTPVAIQQHPRCYPATPPLLGSNAIKEEINIEIKEKEKETHTQRARVVDSRRGTFLHETESRAIRNAILEGLRVRTGLHVLPQEHTFVELADWAFINKLSADRVLLCFDTLEAQRKHPVHWRSGRTTAKTIMENLPTLDDLVLEIKNLENGVNKNGNGRYPTKRTNSDILATRRVNEASEMCSIILDNKKPPFYFNLAERNKSVV